MVKVTKSRGEILNAVADLKRATCAELAEATGRNRGNVYKQLQELIAGGLIERDDDDYVLPRE
jgi:DNA-binding IclR family transcriptional regulator